MEEMARDNKQGNVGFACGTDHDGVLARNIDYRLDFFFFVCAVNDHVGANARKDNGQKNDYNDDNDRKHNLIRFLLKNTSIKLAFSILWDRSFYAEIKVFIPVFIRVVACE